MSKTTESYLAGFWVTDMLEMLQSAAEELDQEYTNALVDGFELHIDLPGTPGKHIVINTHVLERVYDRILADIQNDIDLLFAEGDIYLPLVNFFARSDLGDFDSSEQVESLLNLCVTYAKEG